MRYGKLIGAGLVAGTLGAAAFIAATPSGAPSGASAGDGGTAVGVSATMRFTDSQGQPRQPTQAERAALAAAFQADLAALTRGNRIPTGSRVQPNGAISAVVPPSRMRYLTVTTDEDGNLIYDHAATDENGALAPAADHSLPER